MSRDNFSKQGQSAITEWKERGIAASMKIGMDIFWAKFGDKPYGVYQHIDLNSGEGYNKDFQCIGSPLAFIQQVDSLPGFRYRAHFVDNDKGIIERLRNKPEMNRPDCYIHWGDNRYFCSAIPNLIDITDRHHMAIGSVLIDPNGTDVPLEQIIWLSKECPRLDIIVNWNSTSFKRCQNNPRVSSKGRLEDLIRDVNRRHWLIREPKTSHQFTLLVGRNTPTDDYRSLGFYHLYSPKGQEIFSYCNLTKEEFTKSTRKVQGQLELSL